MDAATAHPALSAARPPYGVAVSRRRPRRARLLGWSGITGALRRRGRRARDVTLLGTSIPGPPGEEGNCLLLVRARRVVGQVHYRLCADCEQGLITGLVIDEHLLGAGLGHRALSHLRFRHPGLTWRTTLDPRAAAGLARRRPRRAVAAGRLCLHASGGRSDATAVAPGV
ncbi:hypothetical protein [Streptomyces sp. NPDC097619]|uniref:hypothetical protein n=1 Tax=Streptomyces sp. NPDC097619 TaxID=3157228 RepID=UPI00332C6470